MAARVSGGGGVPAVSDREMDSVGGYYLVYPSERADYPPLAAFRDWIASEAGVARRTDE